METLKPIAENFRVALVNTLSPYFTMEQIAIIACIGVAIILILAVVLSIFIVVKSSKFIKKKWLIKFGLSDIFSSLGISTLILIILAIIVDGFSTSMIVGLMIFGIWGFWGIRYQVDKKDFYKETGYKGGKLIFRVILNFICGILAIPFLYILLPMWTLRKSPEIFEAVVDSVGDSNDKKSVQHSYFKNEKGEITTVTTLNISEDFSASYYKDEDGKDHTVYTTKH